MRQHLSVATSAIAATVILAACGGGKAPAQSPPALDTAQHAPEVQQQSGVRIARLVQPDTIFGTDGRACIYTGIGADGTHSTKTLMDFGTGDTMPAFCPR